MLSWVGDNIGTDHDAAPDGAPPYGRPPAVPGSVCSLAASEMKSANGTSHTCDVGPNSKVSILPHW